MGSFDDVEMFELVGLYKLSILNKEIGNDNLGLYGDDGVACFKNVSGTAIERIKKKI